MKKYILILMFAFFCFSPATFGQTKVPGDPKVEVRVIALEKAGWQAWKDKDPAWYRANTTEEAIWINSGGVTGKAQMIKDLSTCNVKSFALADFRSVRLTRDAVMMTYTATQEGECGGQKIPSQIRATVNYVKRSGKWLEAMYMETPILAE